MDYAKINEIVSEQEKALRFDHFNHKDAWELGSFLVNRIYDNNIEMAVSIRKVNGYILFQHGTEATNRNNQNWMDRKFNTVTMMERSSFGVWAKSNISGQGIAEHGLSEKDYAFCGGGFPIWLKSGEMVGVLIVSNLPHEQDHQFIIDSLQEYLDVQVPSVEWEE